MGRHTKCQLLRLAADNGFEVFLTADQNLRFQQNLAQTRLGVVVLIAKSNRFTDLLPLVGNALDAIARVFPGKLELVSK